MYKCIKHMALHACTLAIIIKHTLSSGKNFMKITGPGIGMGAAKSNDSETREHLESGPCLLHSK